MKTLTTYDEIERLCEAMIQDFFRRKHQESSFRVDIESFVRDYLGLPIRYAAFAEDHPGRIGFISDGKRPLRVKKDGMIQKVLFPNGTIVIDRYFQNSEEETKKRFTIAHEGAHEVLRRHLPTQPEAGAAFHSEYDKEAINDAKTLKEMMTMNECLANRAAACLLMPYFLVIRALKKYNAAQPVLIYETGILAPQEKLLIKEMADAMGVSFSALYYRLKELKLFDVRPVEEYLHELGCGGES